MSDDKGYRIIDRRRRWGDLDPDGQPIRPVDKRSWPPGIWHMEPDVERWIDAATRLACVAVRGDTGELRGYVGVSPGHLLHGVAYYGCWRGGCKATERGDDCDCPHRPEGWLSCHGGLTYSGARLPNGYFLRVEQVASAQAGASAGSGINAERFASLDLPEPEVQGEPDAGGDLWWFGFDCAHADDLCPGARWRMDGQVYRTFSYVASEIASLAMQIKLLEQALPSQG
jgi:hypothetical protein